MGDSDGWVFFSYFNLLLSFTFLFCHSHPSIHKQNASLSDAKYWLFIVIWLIFLLMDSLQCQNIVIFFSFQNPSKSKQGSISLKKMTHCKKRFILELLETLFPDKVRVTFVFKSVIIEVNYSTNNFLIMNSSYIGNVQITHEKWQNVWRYCPQ